MHKIAQKVTSIALAASMLLSMFATNTVAFADEFTDSTTVSEDATEAPASGEVDAVESVDETDTDNSEAVDEPTETPEPTPSVTDVVDLTHDSTTDTVKDDTTGGEDVVLTDSDESEENTATPETAETFVGIQAVTPEYGDRITANVGDTVTLDALLNRDDVAVTYQWQKKHDFVANEADALYPYEEGEPTWYDFVWEDSTEAETLADTPDFVWQGCEMYFAVVDALDAIGSDTSDVQLAWHTPNFVLDGYAITAGKTDDGTTEVYATNEENTYTARLNEDGKWEFSDESTVALTTDWQSIDGATDASYTFEVTNEDLSASYRCLITVVDEAYREENFKALEDLGTELTDEDKKGDIILSTVQFKVISDEATEETADEDNMPATYASLADSFAVYSADGPALSSDNQWITGLNGNYEYITKNMYDQVTEWFNAGKLDKATADRYWTQIGGAWSGSKVGTANVLDDNGYPTGATRQYMEFPLTDGNMLEVNSEWYGQTVYFRPHNSDNAWTITGTAIEIPAYTAVIRDADKDNYGTGASGTKYKDAVVFLNPWVSDAGRMYAKFLSHPTVSSNGWLKGPNGEKLNQHITVLSVAVEQFNANPDMYMMDAEGNYRIDSIGWGVCVNQEPDLSGKAYYAIKAFLSQGYGMCVGHDTMYAYAGSWYDAHDAGYTDPGARDYKEGGRFGPDKNDGSTRYYVLNSVPNIDNGHWNMNALMGANGGNIDSGTVLPTDAISMILSTGGSHSSYGKAGIMYGSNQLNIRLKPYSGTQANQTVKYRNPTNFPFDLNGVLDASKTHTNSQVAFGPIWVDYAGGNITGAEFGYNPNPTTKTITDPATGRSWFGTSNFYLSGTGNFLMNQIGHLPENSATVSEARLFSNTVMYISQRKQCEICAANQNSQEDSHFVIRVSSVNYMQVLSALQAGGSFWYPLNGCYQVVDDLTLPEGWTPIKNFSGHWNSDAYHVNLASNGQPLFDNTSDTYGMYTTGSNNGWNLGNDKTVGALPVLKLDNQPNVRITGIARVVGDLNALFPDDGVSDYTGYRVVVHATDGTDYDCVVNGDSKYVISNVPTTGMQRAEVFDPNGRSITEYGMIVVDVPNHFWNDCETHPLELLKPTADPIDDYKDWEGPVNKTVGSKLYYDQILSDSDVVWYYRAITESGSTSQWFKIGGPGTSFTTYDGVVKGKINKTTFTQAATNADIPYTESTVTYNTLDYCGEKIQFKCEFTVGGKQYTSLDKAEDGKNGYCEVALRPMFIEQAFDKRVSVGESAAFNFDLYYWKGVTDGVTYTVQYRDENNVWVDIGSDANLFPAGSFEITTKVEDMTQAVADKMGSLQFWPAYFWDPLNNLRESGISTMKKHSTVTLTVKDAAMDWDGLDFRCVFNYKAPAHEIGNNTTIANNEANSRTGHLIVYAPPIEMTPLKAQSLLLNNFDANNGNLAWTSEASNPNSGRRSSDIPLDAIAPDVLNKNGTVYGAANDNKAVYTTKITYFGNKDSAPAITWMFSNMAGGGRLDRFQNVTNSTDGSIQLSYSQVGQRIGNISKLSENVDNMEMSFMNGNGKAFNKFSGYIKLEAMYPTDSANLNNKTYSEWNAIVSLYIDNATNPMDFGDTHYYFLCKAEERYMKNWDSANMQPYTCGRTVAYNFNRSVDSSDPNAHLYNDLGQSSYGAELVLDYTISIKANIPNKATASHNTITTENGSYKNISSLRGITAINDALNNGGAVYNYKNLAIIAPNGIRYMETYFTAGKPVNSRTTIDSRDTVVIDDSVTDSNGNHWSDLFEQVTANDDDYIKNVGTHGFAYRTKSGDVLDKATWEWWWRNAVYYVCYDAPTTDADMDQVYFYIDEQGSGPKVDDKLEGASSASNPYSLYTFTYAGTYEINLYGAGGGTMNPHTSSGGHVKLIVQAEQGAQLYFVKGGAGTIDNRYWENGGASGYGEVHVQLAGGYNGGGKGGTPMQTRNGHGNLLGASGGGATTVAIGLIGTGRLAEYGDTTTAAEYMLGVAGGGGGNQHGAADSTSGSLRNGVVPVNGGNGGGNGTFAVGSSGGMFDSFRAGISGNSSESNCEAPSGGGGGWQGGSANTGSKIWWGDGWAYCKRDGNGGSNYITSVNRTFTGANGKSVTVLEAYSDVGGGATSSGGNFRSYQDGFRPGNGYATVKTVRSAVDRFSRNGHNAYDTAYEDTDPTSGSDPIRVTVNITVANKTYDGTADVATVSFSGNLSSDQMTEVTNATSITYSNKKGTLASAIDASTDQNQNPRSDCGSYTATANCTAQGYIITYKYENTEPGKTYPNGNSSGTGSSVKFDIYPKALTVVGSHSKAYDHTADASIPDARITTGMANRDNVSLSTTVVDGYYADSNGNRVSDAGGPYKIVRESELTLVGNGSTNYYIGTEDYSGSISARGLYVHSLYLEDPTYPRNVKHYDGTTNATIKDILIDGILEGDDVKLASETASGKYKTKDAGQKLNADGTVSSNWPYELDENPITIDATPTLTGKDAKNYFIERQDYSGAIARANLTAQVKNWRGLYGDGVGEDPWHDTKAYGYGTAASDGCWLELDGLVQGDTLTLDPTYKKSHFKTLVDGHEDLVPDETTPVGIYPLTYVGLTEANYPVLKNYIVMVLNGRFEVAQRPLHVTVVDDDKMIYSQNPNFHVNIQMEDVDENLIDVVSDVDATPILDTKLKANDTVSSALYLDNNGTETAIAQEFVDNYDYWKKQTVSESKTNLPFVTDCDEKSVPLYADGTSTDDSFEWAYDEKTCGFCDYNHKPLAPYIVDINTDPTLGNALTVREVVNPNGETVKNYDLIIHKGNLYVHPALLKATVPLYVCMYGSNSNGTVVEPTNYRITNYSTVAIQVKNIKTSGPWTVKNVPGMEYYTGTDYASSAYTMGKNTLRRGELYMRLRDTVLTSGDNAIDHSDTAWVIPKATGDFLNNKITGTAMRIPMAVYTATGNVNDANVCTPVTKVTYTIAPYGGTMPDEAEYEKVESQDWLKDVG